MVLIEIQFNNQKNRNENIKKDLVFSTKQKKIRINLKNQKSK
jgi:hypothetical protein